MKRGIIISLIFVLTTCFQAFSQIWVHFEWGKHDCRECAWMCSSLHLSPRAQIEYQKIIHKYGKKIEKEALRDYYYWDRSAERIYKYRMQRDRELQRLMNPAQFRQFIRLARTRPIRIHDYRGWYMNPHHPDWHPSYDCYRWEDSYWDCRWDYVDGHWHSHFDINLWQPPHNVPRPQPRPEVRPPHNAHKPGKPLPPANRPKDKSHYSSRDDRNPGRTQVGSHSAGGRTETTVNGRSSYSSSSKRNDKVKTQAPAKRSSNNKENKGGRSSR